MIKVLPTSNFFSGQHNRMHLAILVEFVCVYLVVESAVGNTSIANGSLDLATSRLTRVATSLHVHCASNVRTWEAGQ